MTVRRISALVLAILLLLLSCGCTATADFDAPEGKKSVAFSLELRADDRTLTDTDSEAVVTKVLNALKDKLNVTLR